MILQNDEQVLSEGARRERKERLFFTNNPVRPLSLSPTSRRTILTLLLAYIVWTLDVSDAGSCRVQVHVWCSVARSYLMCMSCALPSLRPRPRLVQSTVSCIERQRNVARLQPPSTKKSYRKRPRRRAEQTECQLKPR